LLLESEGTYSVDKPPKISRVRDKSEVVTYTVPHNSVAQVFDYKTKTNKIIFGPRLVKLEPYEQFTVLSFSSGSPKQEDRVKSLIMRLGPDYISDTVEVETSDHAKLTLKLTYSWQFVFNKEDSEDLKKLFQVKDFVGDCCKAIASRIRGIVSSVSFDDFHRDSSNIVQVGVFGKDHNGKLKRPLKFNANNLHITNVDIQSQEPVDKKTREILNESMKLSMQTNIKIKEAEARHSEMRAIQEAKGKVERKKIEDETEAEEQNLVLLQLKAETQAILFTGEAESEAKAKAEQLEIYSQSELDKVKNISEAERIKKMIELNRKEKLYKEEIEHLKRMSEDEISQAQAKSDSVIDKIETMVNAIGKTTLIELAKAGPESQAKLLKSLGIKSFLVTDGKNPINLFNTSNGMIGGIPANSLTNN
jgi:major vault protein